MDNNGQLINYIVQELKRGVPEADVRSALLQAGWPPSPVEHAFIMLRQNDRSAPQTPVGAELPPVSSTIAAPRNPAIEAPRTQPKLMWYAQRRWLLVVVLVVLGLGMAGGFYAINKDTPHQSAINRDIDRKTALSAVVDKLSAYYKAKDTYPTRAKINAVSFSKGEQGFDITDYRDPEWSAANTACTDKSGRAILTNSRGKGCFAYRVTALNGDDCNGAVVKCTRVVITAQLESGKPFIIALDQNKKENL
jgi:hypothetical protein